MRKFHFEPGDEMGFDRFGRKAGIISHEPHQAAPERPEFVAQLRRETPYYDLHHKVRPGITG